MQDSGGGHVKSCICAGEWHKCVVEMAERSWAQWRWGKRWWSTTLAQWLTPLLLFLLSVRSHFLQHVKLFWSFHARFPRLVVHLCERELNQCAVQWKAPQDDFLGSPYYSVQSTKKKKSWNFHETSRTVSVYWFTYKKTRLFVEYYYKKVVM